MSLDILGTSWDQCRSMVQYSFTSTETRRLVRTGSPGWPPRLSHSSWTMSTRRWFYVDFIRWLFGRHHLHLFHGFATALCALFPRFNLTSPNCLWRHELYQQAFSLSFAYSLLTKCTWIEPILSMWSELLKKYYSVLERKKIKSLREKVWSTGFIPISF